MKKCTIFRLTIIIYSGAILSACSNPVGDFGRIDTLRSSHLTQVQQQPSPTIKGASYFNPIHYSELEQRLRLKAHLLYTSNYDIAITDRQYLNGKPDLTGPIRKMALLNSFNNSGLTNTKDRLKSLSKDINKRSRNLAKFHRLAVEVIAQDADRQYINNSVTDIEYIRAMKARRIENRALIKKIHSKLYSRYVAYRHVIDHSQIVEPQMNMSALNAQLQDLKGQIASLKNIN